MFDVSHKPDTLRQAYARAALRVSSPTTLAMIKDGATPKGDAIQAARAAGAIAAKRTSEILPYCHAIPIDYVDIDFSFEGETVFINCHVKTVWKTGVEMEALTGAAVAALAVYDMVKPSDCTVQIDSIKLLDKSGGLNDYATGTKKLAKTLRSAVVVASDTRSPKSDESGKTIIERLRSFEGLFELVDYVVVPDDVEKLCAELERLSDVDWVDLILTTGGTGVGPRDVTPDATSRVIEVELRGVSEAIRMHGQRRTPTSMLSRGIAGIRNKTIVVNLPGSTNAVSESLDALFPALFHAFEILHGQGHQPKGYGQEYQGKP